ncbi:hypothetical protein RND81_01G099500 [Saponaria officinalis]|uniref:Uncharacterized protein n=1 Tax=Saponaria officinalis TaxID=3572 RepID=A0AAW1NEF5_SAPOF
MDNHTTRMRGSIMELSQDVEDNDETQAPNDAILEERGDEDQFDNLNGISDAHGNPTCNQIIAPDALWFYNNSVVKVVTDGIQAYYDAPYTCWKYTSDLVKDQWWRFFRDKFKWLPVHSHMAKDEFIKKAGNRIKDMVNKASKVPDHKRIFWMSTKIRQRLKTIRSSPDFKKRSKKYLHNRMGGPKAGTKHCQGSISSMQIAK